MKTAILLAALCGLASAADPVLTFTGKITDTMCGAHHGMMKDQPDDQCIQACIKGTSSQYALFDGKSVMRLSDQKTPAKYAGRTVKVTGSYNQKSNVIKVASIEPGE